MKIKKNPEDNNPGDEFCATAQQISTNSMSAKTSHQHD